MGSIRTGKASFISASVLLKEFDSNVISIAFQCLLNLPYSYPSSTSISAIQKVMKNFNSNRLRMHLVEIL